MFPGARESHTPPGAKGLCDGGRSQPAGPRECHRRVMARPPSDHDSWPIRGGEGCGGEGCGGHGHQIGPRRRLLVPVGAVPAARSGPRERQRRPPAEPVPPSRVDTRRRRDRARWPLAPQTLPAVRPIAPGGVRVPSLCAALRRLRCGSTGGSGLTSAVRHIQEAQSLPRPRPAGGSLRQRPGLWLAGPVRLFAAWMRGETVCVGARLPGETFRRRRARAGPSGGCDRRCGGWVAVQAAVQALRGPFPVSRRPDLPLRAAWSPVAARGAVARWSVRRLRRLLP